MKDDIVRLLVYNDKSFEYVGGGQSDNEPDKIQKII